MADDGIGHAVVGHFIQSGPPVGVRVEALVGDIFGLAALWRGEADVWLVDAVAGDSAAGNLQVLDHRELFGLPADGLSAHQLSLGESLRWLVHGRPEMAAIKFRLYGVEVGCLRPRVGLSPVVEQAVDRLVKTVRVDASA
jgi:hydrogenase maturation protease